MSARRAAVLLAAVVLAALAAQSARADGDPASDVLIVQTVFLPFQAQLPKALESKLDQTLFVYPVWLLIGVPLFAVLVATLAAVYPARRAARVDPIQALRHE